MERAIASSPKLSLTLKHNDLSTSEILSKNFSIFSGYNLKPPIFIKLSTLPIRNNFFLYFLTRSPVLYHPFINFTFVSKLSKYRSKRFCPLIKSSPTLLLSLKFTLNSHPFSGLPKKLFFIFKSSFLPLGIINDLEASVEP